MKHFLILFIGFLAHIELKAESELQPTLKIEIHEEVLNKAYLVQQFGAHQKVIDSASFSHHIATFHIAGLDTGLYAVRYRLKQFDEWDKLAHEVSVVILQENIHLRIRHIDNKAVVEVTHSPENFRWQMFLRRQNELKQRLQYIFSAKEIFEEESDLIKALKKRLHEEQRQYEKQLAQFKAKRNNSLIDAMMYCTTLPVPPFEFDRDEIISWQHIQLFERCDFNQSILLNSNVYENIVFNYITTQYARSSNREEKEKAVLKSVVRVLEKSKSEPEIQKRLLAFVRNGVEQLQAYSAMKYLQENFPEEKCENQHEERESILLREGMNLPAEGVKLLHEITPGLNSHSKAILIFWAGWCPYSEYLANELRGKPVSKAYPVLLIDLASDKSDCGKSKAKFPDWFQYHCEGKGWETQAAALLRINALPCVMMIDQKFSIIKMPDNIPEMIQLLINSNLTH